jgi:hypothetical protein
MQIKVGIICRSALNIGHLLPNLWTGWKFAFRIASGSGSGLHRADKTVMVLPAAVYLRASCFYICHGFLL